MLVETFLISFVFIDHSELCGLGDLIKNLFELEPISLDDLGVPYARAKATWCCVGCNGALITWRTATFLEFFKQSRSGTHSRPTRCTVCDARSLEGGCRIFEASRFVTSVSVCSTFLLRERESENEQVFWTSLILDCMLEKLKCFPSHQLSGDLWFLQTDPFGRLRNLGTQEVYIVKSMQRITLWHIIWFVVIVQLGLLTSPTRIYIHVDSASMHQGERTWCPGFNSSIPADGAVSFEYTACTEVILS